MSHIEAAVRGSKRIEAVLRDGFGAEGRGLHEYLGSVENRIPIDIVRKARFIASVRNKVVHQEEDIFNLDDFNQSVDEVVYSLNKVLEKELLQKETHERIRREANEQNQSGAKGSRFLMVIAIVIAFCIWMQLQAERERGIQEARKHSQQITALQQQLKNVQEKKISSPPITKETRSGSVEPSATQKTVVTERAEIEVTRLKEVQSRLNELGFNAGVPDGLIGRSTELAIRNFELRNDLPVDGNLTDSDRDLLMSNKAVRAATTISKEGSLLAKALSSGSEYDQALREVSNDLVVMFRERTKITLGNADVSQDADGSFSLRVPVSWSISGQEVLNLLNRYFNSYGGRPLSLSSDHMRSDNNRIIVDKRNAESSSAMKPYSGRLFQELQKVVIYIEVSLGPKSSKLAIAGNAKCHVSCNYVEKNGNAWVAQINGKPGEITLNWKQETPVVIKGLTESDLQKFGFPVAIIR